MSTTLVEFHAVPGGMGWSLYSGTIKATEGDSIIVERVSEGPADRGARERAPEKAGSVGPGPGLRTVGWFGVLWGDGRRVVDKVGEARCKL